MGTLRRIRWTFVPGPTTAAPPHRLTRDDRCMTLSRHAGSSPVRDRFTPASPDSSTLFRARRSPTFHRRRWPRARPPFTRAATLFGALRTSVFGAERCRLPTSATTTTCGHFDLDSRILVGTTAANRLPFLERTLLHALRRRGCVTSRAPSVLRRHGVGSSWLPRFTRPRSNADRVTPRRYPAAG